LDQPEILFDPEQFDGHRFGVAAILGPPNAGKSTLMNTILGQKVAIVTPKPQTTRNQISGILSHESAQVLFLDTPGIHRRKGRMNRFLLQAAWQALAQADVVTAIMDGPAYLSRPSNLERDFAAIRDKSDKLGAPVLLAVNKVDKVKDKGRLLALLQQIADFWPGPEIHPISAISGEGVDDLLTAIIEKLPEGPAMFPDDQVSTVPLRFLASEIIREKVFMALEQELPYTTAVAIEAFEESPELTRIHATIYTSRQNHKAMIIGKRGARLKEVGTQARVELEEVLENKVFLELFVKVKDRWTEDDAFLRTLGFGEELPY
jgi:GTP-binding protein Era